jgi:hypothetical protein
LSRNYSGHRNKAANELWPEPGNFFLFNAIFSGISPASKSSVHPLVPKILFAAAFFAALVSSATASQFPSSGPTITGSAARLRFGGQAAAPINAPLAVKRAIWAANQLRTKPYRWGGGHKSFIDTGYDCSGTISYALGAAGLIPSPMSSTEFRRFGQSGRGKWITVYARNGHTFAIIAGLRLDTTPYLTAHDRFAPRWQSSVRVLAGGFEARHPVGL